MIRLTIVGNRYQAARFAADRGIPAVFESEIRGHTAAAPGELPQPTAITVLVVDSTYMDQCFAWWDERHKAGPTSTGLCIGVADH